METDILEIEEFIDEPETISKSQDTFVTEKISFSEITNNSDLSELVIRKYGRLLICPICKQTFTMNRNLKRHVKFKHPHLLSTLFTSNPNSAYRCNICQSNYKSVRSFQEHNRRIHKRCCDIKKHKCPLCPEEIERRNFDEHFRKCHNLLLEPIQFVFDSYEKFCEWKKAIENVTKSYFSKQTISARNGIRRCIFNCHRSGIFKSKVSEGKRKMRKQGSRKINAYCPAVFRVVVKEDGKCEVSFQSQHVGHENELQHLDLTYEEKKYVANKLATNLPYKDILDDIHNYALMSGNERLCLLNRKDLHNIKLCFMKNNPFCTSKTEPDKQLLNILRDIHSRHAESEFVKGDISKIEKGWILTLTGYNEIYLIKENPKPCDCTHICIYCKVCIKAYSCSCADSCIEENMCKHIHYFCIQRYKAHYDSILNSDNFDVNISSNSEQCLKRSNNILESSGSSEKDIDSITIEEVCHDSNCTFESNNNDMTVDSDSNQYNDMQASNNTLESSDLSKRDNPILIDSQKVNSLKNKFSELIGSIKTEKEYAVFKSTYEELTAKLKAIQRQSTDEVNVIPPSVNVPKDLYFLVKL